MIQTIQIEVEVPEGKKAVWKDGQLVYEDIHKKLPKTWEEFCKLYPIKQGEAYIDVYSNIKEFEDDVLGYRTTVNYNVLPSTESAEQHLAYMKLHQLRDCYRQDWLPDYTDSNTPKYSIYLQENEYGILTIHSISRFLTFQSREIAEEFLNNFKEFIKKAGDLI